MPSVHFQKSSDANVLLLMPALKAMPGSAESVVMTRKFFDGVCEYASRWHGRVIVAMERTSQPSDNLDPIELHAHDMPFEFCWLDWTDADAVTALLKQATVVLGTLVDKHVALARQCQNVGVPLVYISEYSVRTRQQIIRAEISNPILRWRRLNWTARLETQYRAAVKLARGVQCNGTPTFHDYREVNPSPLLYFDTRVRGRQLVDEPTLEARLAYLMTMQPLRLAFSGRLIAMKGADHLPLVAAELKRLNVPFTMDIFGAGVLQRPMQDHVHQMQLSQAVRVRGTVDFNEQLLPHMKTSCDLFVCCHRQGDPSCTYLETMSCGVPIVSYDNEAFGGICRASCSGWLAPMDQPRALAQRIAQLHKHRQAIDNASRLALQFASQHTFEITMEHRVQHLRECANRVSSRARIETIAC